MSHLCVFLNTKVENSGILAGIGDRCLAPFRYWNNGKTIRIERPGVFSQKTEFHIHHVASFHEAGHLSRSLTCDRLTSSPTGMIKTALSIVLIIPGFFLGVVFKGLAYCYADVREKHWLAIEHFTPVDREIGSVNNPMITKGHFYSALNAEFKSNPKNPPTNALIIHGDGNLKLDMIDSGISKWNPMKLILVGGEIERDFSLQESLPERLLMWSDKWQGSRDCYKNDPTKKTFAKTHAVNTIDEALQATAPRRSLCKRYHMIFYVPRAL